jgi:general secretion pathway protein A
MQRHAQQSRHLPFSDDLNLAFYFASPSHTRALQAMLQAIGTQPGPVGLISQAGLGKTMLLHAYLTTVEPERLQAIYLPACALQDILATLCQHLGCSTPTVSATALRQQLRSALHAVYKAGRQVALILDEAHNLSVATLEQLFLLANLHAIETTCLQIVLVGRPALQQTLSHPALRRFTQHLVLCPPLLPLTQEESHAYIQYRLAQVAQHHEPLFTNGAVQRIIAYAQGNPRVLNDVCARVCIVGELFQERPVTSTTANKVLTRIGKKRQRPLWRVALAGMVSLPLGMGFLLAAPSFTGLNPQQVSLDVAHYLHHWFGRHNPGPPPDRSEFSSVPTATEHRDQQAVQVSDTPQPRSILSDHREQLPIAQQQGVMALPVSPPNPDDDDACLIAMLEGNLCTSSPVAPQAPGMHPVLAPTSHAPPQGKGALPKTLR